MAENYDSEEMLKALTALNERSTRTGLSGLAGLSSRGSGFDLGEDLIKAEGKRKGSTDALTASPLGLTQPDFGFDLPKGYSRGGGGDSKFGTEAPASVAATRSMLAYDKWLEKEEAKRNKPTSGSVLEEQAAKEQGISVEELRTKRATSAQGPDKPGFGLLLDPNKTWSEAITGNETWDKKLDWEAKAQQIKLWGEARFAAERARAEEQLGKPIKDNDPFLAQRKKEIFKEANDSIGAKPKKDYFDNDSIDTAVYNFRMIGVNRDINQAKTPEALEAAQARAKELKDTLDSKSSAYTLDAAKKHARRKAELEEFNLRTNGSRDLSAKQEASLAYDSSTDQLFKNIIGNTPSLFLTVGASLLGGKVGAVTGSVLPGVGTVIGGIGGAAAASAAVNQELGANEIAGSISDTFKNTKLEDLMKSERFRELYQIHNGDERLARFAVTREAMDSVDSEARLFLAGTGALEGLGAGGIVKKGINAVAGKSLANPVVSKVLSKYGISPIAASNSVVSRASASLVKDAAEKSATRAAVEVVKRPLAEFGTEFVEEGGSTVLGNIAQQRVGYDQRTFEGAVGSGVEGGIVGLGTAGGLQAGSKVASKLFGPVLDQNDIVVTRDKKGGLTAARRSSVAEESNTVVNPDTGFARMRDVNSTVDPAGLMDRTAINTRVSEALAVASGMPVEAGTLAGLGVNALLRGQDTSLTLPAGSGSIGLIALSDGSLTLADPSTATPETRAFIQQANELVSGLRPGLTAFAGKQLNYNPTPAGSIVATPPVGPPPPLVGPSPTGPAGPMGGGGTPPAGTPAGRANFTGSELDAMLGVADPNSPFFTGGASTPAATPATPQSDASIAQALPAGLTDAQIPAAVDAWIATNSPQLPEAARAGLRTAVAAAYRQRGTTPTGTTPTGTTPTGTTPTGTTPTALPRAIDNTVRGARVTDGGAVIEWLQRFPPTTDVPPRLPDSERAAIRAAAVRAGIPDNRLRDAPNGVEVTRPLRGGRAIVTRAERNPTNIARNIEAAARSGLPFSVVSTAAGETRVLLTSAQPATGTTPAATTPAATTPAATTPAATGTTPPVVAPPVAPPPVAPPPASTAQAEAALTALRGGASAADALGVAPGGAVVFRPNGRLQNPYGPLSSIIDYFVTGRPLVSRRSAGRDLIVGTSPNLEGSFPAAALEEALRLNPTLTWQVIPAAQVPPSQVPVPLSYTGRAFTVMQSASDKETLNFPVPWGFAEALAPMLQRNHSQTPERLDQRGGITSYELANAIAGLDPVSNTNPLRGMANGSQMEANIVRDAVDAFLRGESVADIKAAALDTINNPGVIPPTATGTTTQAGGQNAVQVGSATQVPVGQGAQGSTQVGQGNAQGQAPAGQAQTQGQVVTPPSVTTTPAPTPAESGLPADVTAEVQALNNQVAQVRQDPNLSLFQQTVAIVDIIRPAMVANTAAYQAYARDQVQAFPDLEWARNTIGVDIQAGASRGQAWADATLNQNNDPMSALNGIINDPAAGEVNRQAARVVVQLYQSSGVPMPTVTNRGDGRVGVVGYYVPSEHRIDFNPTTMAATVVHEHLHALTARGLGRVEILARQGDQAAKDLLALVNYLYSKMPAGRRMAYNSREMLAEMLRPEQLAYAYSNDIALSDMPADARRAYDTMVSGTPASQQPTLLSAIRAMFESVLGFLGAPTQNIPLMTDAMMRVTAELANRTAAELNRAGGTARTTPPAATTPAATTPAATTPAATTPAATTPAATTPAATPPAATSIDIASTLVADLPGAEQGTDSPTYGDRARFIVESEPTLSSRSDANDLVLFVRGALRNSQPNSTVLSALEQRAAALVAERAAGGHPPNYNAYSEGRLRVVIQALTQQGSATTGNRGVFLRLRDAESRGAGGWDLRSALGNGGAFSLAAGDKITFTGDIELESDPARRGVTVPAGVPLTFVSGGSGNILVRNPSGDRFTIFSATVENALRRNPNLDFTATQASAQAATPPTATPPTATPPTATPPTATPPTATPPTATGTAATPPTATGTAATPPLSEDTRRLLSGGAQVAVNSNYTEAEARGLFTRLLATGAVELEQGQGDAAIEFAMQEFRRLQGTAATGAATPPAATPPANQPLRDLNTALPRDLMRAGGNYQQHRVQFARDLDRAAWIARRGQRRQSTRDADMVAFVQSITGWSEREVRNHGDAVHRAIGVLARQAAAPDSTISLPTQPINTPFGTSAPAAPAARSILRTPAAPAAQASLAGLPPAFEGRDSNRDNVSSAPTGLSNAEFTDRSTVLAQAVVSTGGARSDSYLQGVNLPTDTLSGLGTDNSDADTVRNYIIESLDRGLTPQRILDNVDVGDVISTSQTVSPNGPRSGINYTVREVREDGSLRVESNQQRGTFRDLGVAELQNMAQNGIVWNIEGEPFVFPARYRSEATTLSDRKTSFDSFVRAYIDAANAKLQEALRGASTLEEKRAAGKSVLGINAPSRTYLSSVAYRDGAVSYVYNSDQNVIYERRSATRDFDTAEGQVHFTTSRLAEGSGEGTPFYDAMYGAAVHSGLPIRVTGLYSANKRRMPINRLRAILRWGNFFGDLSRAQQVLRLEQGYIPRAGAEAVDDMLMLDGLFQHVEASLTSSLNPNGGRPIGYDFDNNVVVIGPNRTPVPNLRAWLSTQSANVVDQTEAFVNRPTEDGVRLVAIMRELANAPSQQAANDLVSQLNPQATARLFDRPAGEVDAAAPVDGLFGEQADEAPVGPEAPATPQRRGLMRRDNEPAGGAPSDALFDQAPAAPTPAGTTPTAPSPGPRAPGTTVANILAGQPAPAATDLRGFTQALLRPGTAKQKRDRAAPFAKKFGDSVKTSFVDSLVPMVLWVQSLPIPEVLKDKINGAMYRAPNIRDAVLTRVENEYGGRELNAALDQMARAYKAKNKSASTEDVVRSAGFWLTGSYTLIKNQRMLDADLDAADAAQAAADKAVTDNAPSADIAALQTEAIRLRHIAEDRAYAMAQSNPPDNKHFGISRNGEAPLPVGLAGGLTTAQAEALIQDAESKFGVGALEAMAKHVYKMNAYRLTVDITSGRLDVNNVRLFSPELDSAMPELMNLLNVSSNPASTQSQLEAARNAAVNAITASGSKYVPTTGDPEKGFEGDVLGNGFNTPNVAKERRLQGRATSIADDGITASIGGMQRSAAAAGWSDYSVAVEEAYNAMTDEQRKAAGMKQVNITVLQRLSDNVVIRNNPDGSATGYSIRDGKELAALRRENIEERTTLMRGLDAPTRWFATMMTRWNLPFGPINMIRDVWERSENMRARIYYAATGKQIDSTRAAQRMLQIARNPQLLMDISKVQWAEYRGQKQTNSKYGDYLREFEEQGGGGGKRGTALARDRKSLIQGIESAGTGSLVGKRGIKVATGWVNYWNDTFDTVAPLAAYIAFREQGMTKEGAAAAALDLMNFRKVGTFMPAIRMVYAFAQPTATGAANLINTLKTPRGRIRLLGYVVAMGLFQALIASLGGEDEQTGRSAFDSLDPYSKERSLPIPAPWGGFIKLPLGFGLPLLANQIALGFRDLTSEDVSNREAISTMLKRVAGTALPVNLNSQIKDDLAKQLVQTFAPTVLEGTLNIAINRDGFGGEIVKERFIDRKNEYLSEQGSPMTADTYKDVARFMRSTFGLDMAPEQVKEFIDSMSFGVFKGAQTALVDNPWKEATGRPTKVPFVSSLLANTDNAIIGDSARFERAAGAINKELNLDPEKPLTPREASTMEIYERWEEVQKKYQKESRALTKRGEEKGANPVRLDLTKRQREEQSALIREFNALNR